MTKQAPTLSRAQLDAHKTKYAVTGGGWIENYLGHGEHYDAHTDGDKRTVELLPVQAEYYLGSGQIEPIPGETKGYPCDAQTGAVIDLDADARARIQEAPSIGSLTTGEPNVLGESQGSSESALEVAETSTASTVEEPAGVDTPDEGGTSTTKTRRSGRAQ